jgi:hypothetical protein
MKTPAIGMPPAFPSIPATRRSIAAEMTRRSIERYEEAKARLAETFARTADDSELTKWDNVAGNAETSAERNLIQAIANWHGATSWTVMDAECRRWPVCGVALGDKVYLIVPDSNSRDDVEVGQRQDDTERTWITQLAVANRGDVIDLDDILAPVDHAGIEPTASPEDEAAEVASALRAALDRVAELQGEYNRQAKAGDKEAVRAFESEAWEPACAAMDEAERRLIEALEATDRQGIAVNGRLYVRNLGDAGLGLEHYCQGLSVVTLDKVGGLGGSTRP